MSAGKIYSATYSGIQVYEMMIHGIATMVRGSDQYLNATQILKVAGFEKTRRSKILEREVLTGEHEKVQGGYGKYQGTWIPFEKGKELAEKYEVLDRMMPLLTFDPASISNNEEIPTKEQVQLEARQQIGNSPQASPFQALKNKKRKLSDVELTTIMDDDDDDYDDTFDEQHRNLLMNIFLSDNINDIPAGLTSTLITNDINIDLVIDEQGHTALHWAAALGRTKIIDLLIANGANVNSVNYQGETPLMRAAMITCCYEHKCFHHMVEAFSESIHVFDKKGRSILHHIALTSDVTGYSDAAIYYIKKLFKSTNKKTILKTIVNVKDQFYDETALSIAKRTGCQEIVDFLLKQGAIDDYIEDTVTTNEQYIPTQYQNQSPTILNNLTAQIQEMEKLYQGELNKKDLESFQLRHQMEQLKYQLDESNKRLELPVSVQLSQSLKKIKELQQQLLSVTTEDESNITTNNNNNNNYDTTTTTTSEEDKSTKERKLEKKLKSLQNQLDTSVKQNERLKQEIEQQKQKEMEYRRLIAASCNLPIEKIDNLVGPLTLAVESDPPDLDMARIIHFMEQMKKK